MPLEFRRMINRKMLRNEPEKIFVFGDNVERTGYGGQAREMRGEPNSFGIVTKLKPEMTEDSYFQKENEEHIHLVQADLYKLIDHLDSNKVVVVPFHGIGTGLAELPTRAPDIHKMIIKSFHWYYQNYGGEECPWVVPE